jgi:hypothetical protein
VLICWQAKPAKWQTEHAPEKDVIDNTATNPGTIPDAGGKAAEAAVPDAQAAADEIKPAPAPQ